MHGSDGSQVCGSTDCSSTNPAAAQTQACWIRYSHLHEVGKCEDVKLGALITAAEATAITGAKGTVSQKAVLQGTNVKIDKKDAKLNGIQCMIAGCDYDVPANGNAGARAKNTVQR